MPTQGHMRLTQWVKLTHRAHRGEHPQRSNPQGLLSQWVCSSPTCLNHRSESQRRNRSGWALFHQPGSRPHHRQGSDSHRAKGKLASMSRAGSGHSNNSQSSDQRDKGTTSQPTSPMRVQTPQQEELGSCSLHKRDRRHKKKLDKMRGQRNML